MMNKYLVFSIIFFYSFLTYPQSNNYQKFKKLSNQKKWWVFFHPFKAKRTLTISKKAIKISDSIRKTKTLDGDKSGGQVDAFRHAFWMASLRLKIGESAARSLGIAHEKENYQYYKDNKLEDGTIPDKAAMDMDLYNNEVGLSLVKNKEEITEKELIKKIIIAIKKGKMKVIKKDEKRRFLTCKGELINKQNLKGKWINNKCLVNSNEITKAN